MHKKFSSGLLGSNTYVVWDEESREAMIIDAGNPVYEIKKFVDEKGLIPKHVVLTHSHYDHAHYAREYLDTFDGATLLLHRDEAPLMNDPEANVSMYFGAYECYGTADRLLFE